jgi:hypothetical protein
MENKIITIDTTLKKPPLFIEKSNTPEDNNGYILCVVQTKENEIWDGRVISMTTNGKYVVELLERSI